MVRGVGLVGALFVIALALTPRSADAQVPAGADALLRTPIDEQDG
jgi:hypothetical protein